MTNAAGYKPTLGERRALLLERSAQQRMALTDQAAALQQGARLVDGGLSLFTRIKKKPLLIGGLAFAVTLMTSRRLLPVLKSGLFIWEAVRLFKARVKRPNNNDVT